MKRDWPVVVTQILMVPLYALVLATLLVTFAWGEWKKSRTT